ncbi:MAG: DUF1501 domain-containing protein, partial [Isosphaeraceae bacterium]
MSTGATMNAFDPHGFARRIHRRSFLERGAYGLGGLALAQLMGRLAETPAAAAGVQGDRWKGVITTPHRPIKAKRVIHLCMAGGPSQFETLDWKPALKKLDGQPFPASLTNGQQLAQLQNTTLLARGPFTNFKKWGQSGQEIAEVLPQIGSIADEIAIVR